MLCTGTPDYLRLMRVMVRRGTMRVAICGPMASGKTHLADALIQQHDFSRVSLARGVKLMGDRILESLIESGVVDAQQRDVKQRRMLQAIGAVGREIDPMVWINDTLRCASEHDRVVVDDLRFVNEAVALADYGFIIVRLNFPEEEFQKERLMRAYPDDWERHWNARNDISETEIRAIPSDMIDLEITVDDGDTNWLAMIEHLWLT